MCTRWTTIAAENGAGVRSCAPETGSSRSAARRIVSPAATTAAASSRSTRASRRAGRSNSPTPTVPGCPDMQRRSRIPTSLEGTDIQRRSRRTKIIATLGPASDSPEMIGRLHEAGADVFRLNMSHLPRERLRERVETIRGVEAKAKRPVAILADLQGPKLRVGGFHGDGAQLLEGQRFTFDADEDAGDDNRVYLPHPEILSALEPGHAVLIDDGKLRLTVEDVSKGRAVTRVAV